MRNRSPKTEYPQKRLQQSLWCATSSWHHCLLLFWRQPKFLAIIDEALLWGSSRKGTGPLQLTGEESIWFLYLVDYCPLFYCKKSAHSSIETFMKSNMALDQTIRGYTQYLLYDYWLKKLEKDVQKYIYRFLWISSTLIEFLKLLK